MKGKKKVQELPIKELPIPSTESAVPRTRRIENRRIGEGLDEAPHVKGPSEIRSPKPGPAR